MRKPIKIAVISILSLMILALLGFGLIFGPLMLGWAQITAAATDMRTLIRHELPPRATLLRTEAFLESRDVAAFARAHHLQPVLLEEVETSAAYAVRTGTSLVYPHGVVLPATLPGDDPATSLDLTFFFDAKGHLVQSTVNPTQGFT